MPVYAANFSGRSNHQLQLHISLRSQSIEGNYSIFDWGLYVVRTSGVGSWSLSPKGSASVNVEGQVWSRGGWTYDFRNSTSLLIGSGAFVVYHAADGTLTLSSSAAANSDSTLGSASFGTQEWAIPTIPRASKPTYSPEPVDAGVMTTITTNRASSGFTHTIDYAFGSASGSIGTGIGASTTWTPPLSLLNEIPNATSGDVAIITKTYSGATLIGSSTTYLTIKVPATAVPTFGTVTHSEAIAGVAANVGAYVQGISKLNLAITDAEGVYGSTITAYKIEVLGQIINAASGVSNLLTVSGTVALKGTVTDSRGRTSTETVNVNVLAYAPPVINSISFQRALVSGTPDEEGTYIRVNLNASVQSLIVGGTQKNDLVYKIYTRARNAPTWTLKKTVPVGAVTFNSYDLVSSYAIEDSWEVLVEVSDDFATSAIAGTIATSRIFMHWGGVGEGLAIGKFWEQGGLDILGQAYQNNGLAILDTSSAYTKTELNNGQLDTRYYTETEIFGLFARPVRGVVPATVSLGSGSASVADDGTVTFTGCSRVSLNNVFDGIGADVYEIFISSVGTTNNYQYLRLRTNDVDNTATTYNRMAHGTYFNNGPIRSQAFPDNVLSYLFPYAGAAPSISAKLTMFTPKKPGWLAQCLTDALSAASDRYKWSEYGQGAGGANDGFSLIAAGGTMSGTIKVVKIA